MDQFVKSKIEQGKSLFSARRNISNLWQEQGELFYPERAMFTTTHLTGMALGSGNISSVPALARREMGDLFRAMLRPRDFMEIKTANAAVNDNKNAAAWLEWATELQRKSMYRKGAHFVKSTVLSDHDYVTFGQGPLEVLPLRDRKGIYYKNNHLKDVAWTEDYTGAVKDVHKRAMPTLQVLKYLFPKTFPQELESALKDDAQQTVEVQNIVVPIDEDYDGPRYGNHKFCSMWVLVEQEKLLEKVTRTYRGHVIPRADQPNGSQYAYSPFTTIILPDARTKQAIEAVLLEGGQKAVDPPMLMYGDVVRGDVGLYAGGMTVLDIDYDERGGDPLRPVNQNYRGLPYGVEMSDRYDEIITQGMRLNKINLPADLGNMTAFEVRQRIEEHMRAHIPMFEPVEVEYNEPLASETFDVLASLNAFEFENMPEELSNAQIEYEFKSPIKDLEAQNKTQMLMEGMEAINVVAGGDPQKAMQLRQRIDEEEILDDVLRKAGWPESWLKDEAALTQIKQANMEQLESDKAMQEVAQAAEIANKAAPAVQALQEAA